MRQHSLRVDDDLWIRMEAERGDVPRNTWIIRAIESRLPKPLGQPTVEDANRLVLDKQPTLDPAEAAHEMAAVGSIDRLAGVRNNHLATCRCPLCKPPRPRK